MKEIRLDGHDSAATVRAFIPRSDENQTIAETRSNDPANMKVRVESDVLTGNGRKR